MVQKKPPLPDCFMTNTPMAYSNHKHLIRNKQTNKQTKNKKTKKQKKIIDYFKCKSLKRSYPLGASLHYLVLAD